VKKRRLQLFVILAVGAALVFALTQYRREPKFEGRTLSAWIQMGLDRPMPKKNLDVTNAVRNMGAAGIPTLLDYLSARPSMLERYLNSRDDYERFPRAWRMRASDRINVGLYGFCILGTQAMPALPALSNLVLETEHSVYPAEALAQLGPAALPALRLALTNDSFGVNASAARALATHPALARAATNELLGLRTHTNFALPHLMITTLVRYCVDCDLTPVLPEYLTNAPAPVVHTALRALDGLRRDRTLVVPLVRPFLTHTNVRLRVAATNALRRLEAPDGEVGR
jgi:hypothetical protein